MTVQNNDKKYLINMFRKRWRSIVVIMISIYAMYLRIMYLKQHTLWVDEKFYLRPLRGTIPEMLRALPNNQVFPYLAGDVFIFYPFFKVFSYNKWGLAIPCIIATLIGFYFLYLVCKRYFQTNGGFLIAFSVVCLNATLIQHATEIRTYAFLPTIALASFYVSQRLADRNFVLTRLEKIGTIVFFVFVIWFHAYGIMMFILFFLFPLFIGYMDDKSKINLRKAFSLGLTVLAAAAPLWILSVYMSRIDHSRMGISTFRFIPNPFDNFIGFLKGIFGNLIGRRELYFLIIGTVFPFLLPFRQRKKQIFFFFFVIILPIAAILLSDVLKKYWFMQRQFIWVMPLFAFYLGWTWDSLIVYIQRRQIFKIIKERF